MVGNSPHRSASPMSARPNPNPNPNPRSNNIERKSFNGYPFVKSSLIHQQKGFVPNTPVNSPAEYARCSFGRDSGGVPFRDHEQKENERDHNMKPIARAKSPSIITTKGTKHFMSPTISAASKINPSPRKKVLGERNDAIRTSASLSDGKFHFFTTNSLDFDNESESKSVMEHPPCSITPLSFDKVENGSDSSHEEVKIEAFEADLVVLSPEVPLSIVKSSESLPLSEMPSTVADQNTGLDATPCAKVPLDAADSSLPPYDPKNNFLSPRPQFLHYNPNWRTENYVNQGVNLEDDFTSESVSETENSSEEVQSEESLKDDSSTVGVSSEELPQLSEANPNESGEIIEMVEPELEPKRSRWFNWKIAAVLLLFSLGFMSISLTFYPDIIGSAMYRDEIISQIYNSPHIAALAENFNVLVQNAKVWSTLLVDYLSQILNNVKGVEKFSSVAFGNLTAWQEVENRGFVVTEIELLPYFESIEDDLQTARGKSSEALAEMLDYSELDDDQTVAQVQIHKEPEVDDTFADGADVIELDESQPEEARQIHEIEVQSYLTPENNYDTSAEGDAIINLDGSQPEEAGSEQMQSSPTPEHNEALIGDDEQALIGDDEIINAVESGNDVVSADEPENMVDESGSDAVNIEADLSHSPPHVPEIQQEVNFENEPSEKADVSPADDVQPVETDVTEPVTESGVHKTTDENSQILEEKEKSLAPIVASVILVIVSLIASFMYMKSKKDGPSTDQVIPETKKANVEEPSLSETPSFRSGQVEVDMVGESCPSEMSSFQNTAYTKSLQRERDGDEADGSLHKRSKRSNKRESLASSSSEYTMNSNYGSFSTYSVIHPKHGDDQVVTPVRRSSRIRSKVASP